MGLAFSGPSSYQFIDLTGKVFGRLTVLGLAGRSVHRSQLWLCECECGSQVEANGAVLRRGASKSCGCLARELTSIRARRHGMAQTKEYQLWGAMLRRCLNPNAAGYRQYGGRGIKVCERWMDFGNFYADMGPRPSPRHSLDRFPDQNGDYEPGNCRWATSTEQARNTRSNRMIEFRGESRCLAEWSEILNVPYHTLKARLNRMSVEESFTRPLRISRHASTRV